MSFPGRPIMRIGEIVEKFHNEDRQTLLEICKNLFGVDGLESDECQRYATVYLSAKRDTSFFMDELCSKKMIVKMAKAFGKEINSLDSTISGLLEDLSTQGRMDAENMEEEIVADPYYYHFMNEKIFPCGEAKKYIADIIWRVASKIISGEWPKDMPPDWKPDYPTVEDSNLPQRELLL